MAPEHLLNTSSHIFRKVFWSDWGQEVSSDGRTSGVIEEMNLDGTGRKIIANDTGGPEGLTIDNESNNI